MNLQTKRKSALSLTLALCSGALWAEETTQLDTITVTANVPANPAQHLTAEQIAKLPQRSGNINELLRLNPAVQFSATTNSATQAGEISPALVSFHGEAYYNNHFLIDGLSNNDITNPASSNGGYKGEREFENPATLDLAPSSPESFYIDRSLLKNITVYDSNVPAKFSHFTGGVVDAQLKSPETDASHGSISYRTTRDRWTKFLLNDEEKAEFESADATLDVQPKFVKQSYQLTLNQPLSDSTGVLFSYHRSQSKMPEYHSLLGEWQKERRLSETVLLKGSHQYDNHLFSLTGIYSPHKSVYYLDNSKNGRYQAQGGGWRLSAESNLNYDWGKIDTTLGYQHQRNRLNYDGGSDYYTWLGSAYVKNSSLNWCSQTLTNGKCLYSKEGGLGDLRTSTQSWTLKQDYNLSPRFLGRTEHQWAFGWQFARHQAQSEREQDLRYFWNNPNKASGYPANTQKVSANCVDCVKGEQYQTSLIRYPAHHTKVNLNDYTLYLADEIQLERLKINLGANLNYNSFLKNWNLAPRFSTSIDLFNDGRFTLIGGLNRYYADSLLAYALRANRPCRTKWSRLNDPKKGESGWQNQGCTSNDVKWANSHLRTPYSDEANLGFQWQFADQLLGFKWVNRHSRDQFTPSERKADEPRTMTNNGKGKTDTFSLDLRNRSPFSLGVLEINYRAGLRYQKRKINYHGNYDSSLVAEVATNSTPYYLFDGKRYDSIENLPPFNFNRPWEGFFEFETNLPKWQFNWTHTLNFRSGYKHYVREKVQQCAKSSQPQACGDWRGAVYDYQRTAYKPKITLDWHLSWAKKLYKNHQLELNLDVFNVFNSKIATSSNQSNYLAGTAKQSLVGFETGRQFWLGAAYRW